MDAGRELDALIAERVMGWHKGTGGAIAGPGTGYEWPAYWHDSAGKQQAPCVEDRFAGLAPWSPSTDIAAAWLVAGKMEERGYWCEMRTPFMDPHGDDGYWTGFTRHGTSGWNGTPDHWTSSASLPHAICLAALACLEAEAERRTMPDDD